jgi:hypothetical protein
MKTTLTMKTYSDRHRDERAAMQETVQRAMCRVATARMQPPTTTNRRPVCRDLLHSI